jgi:integrase
LDWRHVDLKDFGAVELAADEEGRKPGGSWRLVPLVRPLRTILRRVWISRAARRRAKSAHRASTAPPGCSRSATSSAASTVTGARQSSRPIGLHEARHTAATWLDHAGVSPKVASELMGHRTPEYQPGAAVITLRRCTHMLPGELERAGDLLDAFNAQRAREDVARS